MGTHTDTSPVSASELVHTHMLSLSGRPSTPPTPWCAGSPTELTINQLGNFFSIVRLATGGALDRPAHMLCSPPPLNDNESPKKTPSTKAHKSVCLHTRLHSPHPHSRTDNKHLPTHNGGTSDCDTGAFSSTGMVALGRSKRR